MATRARGIGIWAAWLTLGVLLAAFAAALLAASPLYETERDLIDMPSIPLAVALVGVGALFLFTLPLIRISVDAGLGASRPLLALVLVVGAILRLILFFSTPAFEDDWYRYLWDGAVTAQGANPYAQSPDDAQGEPFHYTLRPLAEASGRVIERVNHPHLKTIYPPVAQAAFALAYKIEPWSLAAWRGVLLACEAATLVLLLTLLAEAGRSPLWVALYWLNPIVVKEIANSAHMEGIVTPLVLGTLLLAVRKRHVAAAGMLGLAIGAKLWPVTLAPLVLRPLLDSPRRLLAALAVLGGLALLWAAPIVAGGLDTSSGFVAFAKHWRTNSAHFPALDSAIAWFLSGWDIARTTPGLIARALLAAAVFGVALAMAIRPIAGAQDLMARAGIVTGALYLLSPVQFPWYAIWMIPYLCFRPSPGLLAVTALVPVYYASFHFFARDTHEIFRTYVVWGIWLPIWALLAWEAWSGTREKDPAEMNLGPRHA